MNFKILPVVFSLLALVACGAEKQEDIMGCGNISSSVFDITDFATEVYLRPEDRNIISGYFFNTYDNTEVDYDGIIISLEADVQYLAVNLNKSRGISFSLFSKAYACSPLPPHTNEKIVDIKVTSSAPFSSELAAGDSLVDVFDVSYSSAAESSSAEYYEYENNEPVFYRLPEYLAQDDLHAGARLQLVLNRAPEVADSFIFFIEVTLDSGEIFSIETSEISLKGA